MKKYFNILALVLITTSLSSCLKNKYNALDPDKSPSVVEFKNPTVISSETPQGALYSMYEFSTDKDDPTRTYTVQLSGADAAPQDINLTIAVDPTAVDKFTASRDESLTEYTSLPSTLYKLSTTNLVIPKGQRSASFTVTYDIANFNFDLDYALPLTIKSTSYASISSNFGTILINMSPKNDYDGIYKVTTLSFKNDLAADHQAITPRTRHLVTVGKYKSLNFDPALNAYSIAISTSTGNSQYGGFSPVFEANTAGNVVSVTNWYPSSANANVRTAKINPAGVNKIVATGPSKGMEVSYYMLQKGVNVLAITEKWEFVSKRP